MIARAMRIADLEALLTLLTGQRQESGLGLERASLEQALCVLFRRPDLGAVFVLDEGGTLVGGTVVTIGFSLERGGRAMVVNALCVRSPDRDQGLGRLLIDRVLAFARRAECRAIVLEPPLDDHQTCRWYDDLGFEHRHREYCSASVTELSLRLDAA
jgi:ribosomal protein S18 acetylase RimI-like enzyme